jgi:hypothetical protein
VLKVDGNAVLPTEHRLEVCGANAEPGSIHAFRPIDPLEHLNIDDLVAPGESVNVTALAWRTKGEKPEEGKKPGGAAQKTAGALFSRWEREGLGSVHDGKQGAKVFTRKECTE